ncbi:SSU0592/SSU0593 family protein [Streptococcus suis]
MKRIVTKRSYKVGLCAMALALLMSTAGGVTAGAQGHNFTSSDSSGMRNTQVLVKGNTSNRSSVKTLKVATPRVASLTSSKRSETWSDYIQEKFKNLKKAFWLGFGIKQLFKISWWRFW